MAPTLYFDNLLADWKASVQALEPSCYRTVYGRVGKEEFEVLEFSQYSEELDGEKSLIGTSLTEFTESPMYFARRVVYGAGGRVIKKRDRKLFVLEQGTQALEYLAAQDEISVKELVRASREADLGRAIAKRIKARERRRRVDLEVAIEARDERIADLSAEIAALTAERSHLSRELAARGAE